MMSTMIERWSLVVILMAMVLGVAVAAATSDPAEPAPYTEPGAAEVEILTQDEIVSAVGGTAFGGEQVAIELGVEPTGSSKRQMVASR